MGKRICATGWRAEIDKKLTLEGSGGAADASLAADVGVPTLGGFGIVGGGIHTADEYAEVASVVPRLYRVGTFGIPPTDKCCAARCASCHRDRLSDPAHVQASRAQRCAKTMEEGG